MRRILFPLAGIALLLSTPLSAEPAKPPKPKNAAKVGNKVITQEEILKEMQEGAGGSAEAFAQLRAKNPQVFSQYYKIFRDQYIGTMLLREEARKQEKKLLDDPEAKKQFERLKDNFLVARFVAAHTKSKITPKALEEANKKFPQEMVTLSQIVLSSEKDARSLIKVLQKGVRSFEHLAKEKSLDKQTGANGGLMTPVLKGRLDGSMQRHINNLKEGGFSSEPLAVRGGFLVLKLNKRAPATLEQATPVLQEMLAMQELQALMAALKVQRGVTLYDLDGNETKDSLLTPGNMPAPAG